MDRERERTQAAFCELARITGRTTDEAALQHMIERLYYASDSGAVQRALDEESTG